MAAAAVPQKRNAFPTDCFLCGTKTSTELCEGCSGRHFCRFCYQRYHTHPKRRNHNRESETKKPPGWTCSFCTLENPASTKICQVCAKTDIHHLVKEESSKVDNKGLVLKEIGNEEVLEGWSCTFCTLVNENTENICKVCAKTRLVQDEKEKEPEKKSWLKRKHDEETDVVYQKRIRRFQAENNIEDRQEAEEKYNNLSKQTPSLNNNHNTNKLRSKSEQSVHFVSSLKSDENEEIARAESQETSLEAKNLQIKTEKLSEVNEFNYVIDENVKLDIREKVEVIEPWVHLASVLNTEEIGESASNLNKETRMEMKEFEIHAEKLSKEKDENVKPEVGNKLEMSQDNNEHHKIEKVIKDELKNVQEESEEEKKDVEELTENLATLSLNEKKAETDPLLSRTSGQHRTNLTSSERSFVRPVRRVSTTKHKHSKTRNGTSDDKSSSRHKCCHIL